MQELYVEGLATHDGPYHASAPVRVQAKRWQGGSAGRAMEPRKVLGRGADAVAMAEGNTAGGAMREPHGGPAGSKNHGMHGISMRENRESPSAPQNLISPGAAQARPRPHS